MNESTRTEIDKVIWRTLRDAGLVEPPVRIEDLLEHLKLHRDFYDLQNPTFLNHVAHRIQVGKHKLVQIIKSVKLFAVLFPDENRFVVDQSLPAPKQEFASFHDSTHRILVWHRSFFLGETAQTLDPDYQEWLEEEANYGGSGLMFCGPIFTQEALQTSPKWSSIELLKKRYKKSWVTTLRRYVEQSHDVPMVMVISTPNWLPKPDDQITRCRHFVRSKKFIEQFPSVHADQLVNAIDDNAAMRRGGLVAEFGVMLMDANDSPHEFMGETFFNRHYLLTLLVHNQPLGKKKFISIIRG